MSEHEVCCVCRGRVPLVDGHLVAHRHRDQFGPCPAGQVEPAATGAALAEAERQVRALARCRSTGGALEIVMREYDRMRAELSRTVADCGICRLGSRTIHIDDDCPRHGDTDGAA